MFCEKCGKENLETSRFCENCGHPLTKVEAAPQNTIDNVDTNSVPNAGTEPVKNNTGINKKTVKIIIGVAAGVVALFTILVVVLVIVFVKASNPTIKLDDYVTIEESGYDGYGYASAKIDWEAIEEKYGEKLSYSKNAKKEYSSLIQYVDPIDWLKNCVRVKIDDNSGLSNGDDIVYTWVLDENIDDYFKNKIVANDGEYHVKELTKVGEFDAFKDLEVYFEGISSYANLRYEYNGEWLSYYDFVFSESSNLSNGDVVTVTVKNTNPEYYVNMYGAIPETYEKEYKVAELDEYVSSYSDISDEYITYLKSESEDKIYAYVASNYANEVKLSNLEYAGYIFNSVKENGNYYSSYNSLYIIFSGTVSHDNNKFKTATVYFPVSYVNILSGTEGFSFRSDEGILGREYFENSTISTKGYVNSLTCYLELINRNDDNYDVELGGKFEKYDENEIVTELDDISDKYKKYILEEAKKLIEDKIEKDYDESSVAKDLKYVGDYLLVAKTQGDNYKTNNRYIVVFSARVSSEEDNFETATVYFPVEYDGLVNITGDEYVYGTEKGVLGKSYFPDSRYYTMGYIDGEKMYSDIITANRDKFKYEVSNTLKQFGK